jgi:hypothetical protein
LPTVTETPSGALLTSLLVRVVAPHFVAGLVMQGDRCTHAAPILAWAVGRSRKALQAAFARQGWTASVIP